MGSPTSRSLDWCRKRGGIAQVVERFNSYAKIRIDLFGIIDLIWIPSDHSAIYGIQATSGDNVAHRSEKALQEPRLRAWLRATGRFEVWGWRKLGDRGKRKLWSLRRVGFSLTDAGVETYEIEQED